MLADFLIWKRCQRIHIKSSSKHIRSQSTDIARLLPADAKAACRFIIDVQKQLRLEPTCVHFKALHRCPTAADGNLLLQNQLDKRCKSLRTC